MLKAKTLAIAAVLAALFFPAYAAETEVENFIRYMQNTHRFDPAYVRQLLSKAKLKNSIINAMNKPGEALPWHEYYPRFINRERIQGGVAFWKKHAATLDKAQRLYGVPAEIITAIIGVETQYGKNTGSFRVIDALYTLAFHYPKRADFFRGELEEFLLLVREEQTPPLRFTGSYAGAMGLGQFIPSSYRNYALDFDGNGRRELYKVTDTIGSIANYLQRHGWQPGAMITLAADVASPRAVPKLLSKKPRHSIRQLQQEGLLFDGGGKVNLDTPVMLFTLETKNGPSYWLGLQNFYVITRYNRSYRYAMAVNLLAEQIRAALTAEK